jgi:hypothetical protein
MNPPDVLDVDGKPYPDRRHGPGQRATDIEHELITNALAIARRSRKVWVVVASAGAAMGSVMTFVLMVFGLKVGGAAELSTYRVEERRRDSVADATIMRHDTMIAANRRAIATLQDGQVDLLAKDKEKMIVLCVIAQQVGASTGGYCAPYTPTKARP